MAFSIAVFVLVSAAFSIGTGVAISFYIEKLFKDS
jgi:hypothetical protein